MKRKYLVLLIAVFFIGCASLLPSRQTVLKSSKSMKSYGGILETYGNIEINETTKDELITYGIFAEAPNVEEISGLDLAAQFSTSPLLKLEHLPRGLQKCIRSTANCTAYRLNLSKIDKKRYGSFWADYLGFRKNERTTGYDIQILLVMVNGRKQYIVVYKQLGGMANIYKEEIKRYPLGFIGDEIPNEANDIIMKAIESAVGY